MAKRPVAIVFTLLGVACLMSIVGFVALYLLVGREPSVPADARLTLRVGGELAETAPNDVVDYLRGNRASTLRSLVDNLRKAKTDDRIHAVMVKPTGFATPHWGKLQEIRDAIVDFKTSGKPVYAYLEYGGDREYYVASAADKVFLMPSSSLDLTGVASYEIFLRGTLDMFGVYPNLLHIGDYKTAVNTFTEKSFTPAHREMTASLTRDLYDQIVRGIGEGRKKNEAEVRRLIDEGPFLPENALRAGLIDDVAYEDEVEEQLGGSSRRDVDAERYANVSLRSLGLNRGPRIAIIYAVGPIVAGESGFDPVNGPVVGSETLIENIRRARRDRSIRAIVLRVDSPGGSATASDAIWRELMLAKREQPGRPLIASMSDLAASGGYYIAMASNAIVAQPSTLTGSIGIFGGKFVTGGLYGKLAANIESLSFGRHAEMDSPVRPYDAEETAKVQEQLQAFYDQFVEKVAEARQSTPERIDQVAQGRVWTGRQAKEHGLVDELGGLDRAVAIAKARANIPSEEDVELVPFPARKTLYELVSEELSGGAARAAIRAWTATHLSSAEQKALAAFGGPLTLFRRGEVLALMPFSLPR
jgi:protease-4